MRYPDGSFQDQKNIMNQDEMKKAAAKAALDYVETGTIIGIGTGSTANHFIDLWPALRARSRVRWPVPTPRPSA